MKEERKRCANKSHFYCGLSERVWRKEDSVDESNCPTASKEDNLETKYSISSMKCVLATVPGRQNPDFVHKGWVRHYLPVKISMNLALIIEKMLANICYKTMNIFFFFEKIETYINIFEWKNLKQDLM